VSLTRYFFLNPTGHFGLTALTFFVAFPFTHVIVDFFTTVEAGLTTGSDDGVGEGSGTAGCAVALCVTFIFIIGAEKWNPAAET
jgi:hypothetical protein